MAKMPRKTWISNILGWTSGNSTLVGPAYKNGLEALWLYSSGNVSVGMNATAGGVFGNWTFSG